MERINAFKQDGLEDRLPQKGLNRLDELSSDGLFDDYDYAYGCVGFRYHFPEFASEIYKARNAQCIAMHESFMIDLYGEGRKTALKRAYKKIDGVREHYEKTLEKVADEILKKADSKSMEEYYSKTLALTPDVVHHILSNVEEYAVPGGLLKPFHGILTCLISGKVGKPGDIFLLSSDGSSDAVLLEYCTSANVVEHYKNDLVILI